jgi:hypothetical protein
MAHAYTASMHVLHANGRIKIWAVQWWEVGNSVMMGDHGNGERLKKCSSLVHAHACTCHVRTYGHASVSAEAPACLRSAADLRSISHWVHAGDGDACIAWVRVSCQPMNMKCSGWSLFSRTCCMPSGSDRHVWRHHKILRCHGRQYRYPQQVIVYIEISYRVDNKENWSEAIYRESDD